MQRLRCMAPAVADWAPDPLQRRLDAAERRIEALRVDVARAAGGPHASAWADLDERERLADEREQRLAEAERRAGGRERALSQREQHLDALVRVRVEAELRVRAPWLAVGAGRVVAQPGATAREPLGAWVADVLDGTGDRPPVAPVPRGIEIDRRPVERQRYVAPARSAARPVAELEID